jgi:F-type H+-transporting ATPase subunit delta
MKGTQVAARYARSLFEIALEQKELEQVFRDVLLLQQACEDSKELRLLLKSPIVKTEKKENVFRALFSNEISPLTLAFLLLLVRKTREKFIPDIAAEFVDQYQVHHNILPVTVTTATPLTEELKVRIGEIMQQYTKATVELSRKIDPEVIGGFVLSWQDKQYDASLSHGIERLRRAIAQINLYVKEI